MDGGTRSAPLGSERVACSRDPGEPPLRRVSGCPAQAIKADTLRQGARTDLQAVGHLPSTAHVLTVADIGAAIGAIEDEQVRLRIFFEFMRARR